MVAYENNFPKLKEWCAINSVELLSWDGRRRGSFTFKHSQGVLSGYVGEALFETVATSGGSRATGFNFLLDVEKTRFVTDRLKEVGCDFVGADCKIMTVKSMASFEVSSGLYAGLTGSVRVESITSNNFCLRFQYLSEKSKREHFTKVANNRGYVIKELPSKMSDKCTLLSPKGNEWTVVWSSFEKSGYNCPEDSSGEKTSYGEKMVAAILNKNKIMYEQQKTFKHGDGKWQYMDFYAEVDGDKYCIEYHGIQHYHDVEYFSNNTLQDIKDRDARKMEYCIENGIRYVEIPYTEDTILKVFKALSKEMPIKKKPTNGDFLKECEDKFSDGEVVEYFKTHSQKMTAEKFGMSTGKLYTICKRAGYKKVSGYTKIEARNVESGEVFVFDSIKSASDTTGVGVKHVLKSKNPDRPRKMWIFKRI